MSNEELKSYKKAKIFYCAHCQKITKLYILSGGCFTKNLAFDIKGKLKNFNP